MKTTKINIFMEQIRKLGTDEFRWFSRIADRLMLAPLPSLGMKLFACFQ